MLTLMYPALAGLALWACFAAFAEPTDSQLAKTLETQVKGQASSTNHTAPPLPSHFAILVADAINSKEGGLPPGLSEAPSELGERQGLNFSGDKGAAASLIRSVAGNSGTPLGNLVALVDTSPQISELAVQTRESMQLLAVALEKSDAKGSFFLNVSAKGAIQGWNKLVSTLLDRMEALYKEPVPDVREWEGIRNFLMDPKTYELRGVLAGFAQTPAK